MEFNNVVKRLVSYFDGYEIFYLKKRSKKYESRDLDIYSAELKEEEGIAVRGIKDKRLVFSYSYDLSNNGIEKLISNCIELLPYLDSDDDYAFSYPQKDNSFFNIYDEEGLKLNDKEKKRLVIEFEKFIIDFDKRIVAARGCELHENEIEVRLLNSNGVFLEGKKTIYAIMGMAVAKENDEVSWYDWQWSFFLKGLSLETFGADIGRKAVSFLGSTQIDTGIYDGLLKPQAACDILGILSSSFLGENLFKNKTRLKDKLEQKCFSEALSIIDSNKAGINAFMFDGEGTYPKENVVVKNGEFLTFLFDIYYGKKFKKASTGNSVRLGIKEPPRCGINGMFITKGNGEISEEVLERGVIIEELIGTHTANPITGDFSLGAIGYLKKERKKIPFKEVIFSGNVFELLNNVIYVGNDLRFYGNYGSPSLLIKGIKISGQ